MSEEAYWFARGYHDGRLRHAVRHGYIRQDFAERTVCSAEDGIEAISRDDYAKTESGYTNFMLARQAYSRGYDCGVLDYFDLDAEEDKA
jgi:hypothetical protein